jgi:phage baseplate assembly protein W
MAERTDYAFPLSFDPASRQPKHADYAGHVAQMVQQVLLTTPGERADRPEFGCGLRALIFADNSDALAAATEMLVQQSLVRWLSGYLTVRSIEVTPVDSELRVRIEYLLISTRASQSVEVRVV